MNKVAFIVLVFFVIACSDKKQEEKLEEIPAVEVSLEKDIIGTWSNITLNVRMKGETGDSTLDVQEGQWEDVLKIKPIITTINEDGTFISTYYTLENELMMTSEGTWYTKGDSLVMIQDNVATSYSTSLDGDIATFKGYLDWDQDGEPDDYYQGTQRKTKN